MQTIHVLSDEVVAQIAAGEVIERPAYVIKELIDNSIDAGASTIQIDICAAGLERIVLQDDGDGMYPEDLPYAFKLHATSKLQHIDELHSTRSFGFRGEALASIAAVSEVALSSRHKSQSIGARITSNSLDIVPHGMAIGTRVVVENLFSQVPVRQKFMKSKQTERRYIIDVITAYAIANPNIHFKVVQDKKIFLDLPAETLLERYTSLMGEAAAHSLIPIKSTDPYLDLTGYIAKPELSSPSTHNQFLYINNRPVSDRIVSGAIKTAYGTLLPKDHHPSVVLFLTVPTQLVDINVHPRKENVSFAHPEEIFANIVAAISAVLQESNLTFATQGFKANIASTLAGTILKDAVLPKKEVKPKLNFSSLQQWHNTYMSIESDTGIIFFDQHAVHERILFEQYSVEFEKERNKKEVIAVQNPIVISLSPADQLVIKEHLRYFEEMGFVITFRSKQILINQVPKLLSDRDLRPVFLECIDDVRKGVTIRATDTLTNKMLSYLACRSAVKAGDRLSQDQMQKLIEDLQHTQNKYTCPHGRPTMIETPKSKLDQLFRRT